MMVIVAMVAGTARAPACSSRRRVADGDNRNCDKEEDSGADSDDEDDWA